MFEYYANINGVIWYKCNRCQLKTRGKPKVCPVCGENEYQAAQQNEAETAAKIDNAMQRLEGILKKYGGGI